MFQTITKAVKWVAIPVLVIVSMFSYFAAGYEFLVDVVVCLGAITLIQRAVWLKEYLWAVALSAVVVVFSPLFLAGKIFLLMGITCCGIFLALVAALRRQPLAVDGNKPGG